MFGKIARWATNDEVGPAYLIALMAAAVVSVTYAAVLLYGGAA